MLYARMQEVGNQAERIQTMCGLQKGLSFGSCGSIIPFTIRLTLRLVDMVL